MAAKQPKPVYWNRLISAADAILTDAKCQNPGAHTPASAGFTAEEIFEAYLFLCRLGLEKDTKRKTANA